MSEYAEQIAQLETQLAELRRAEKDAQKARAEAVVPKYAFALSVDSSNFEKIWDESLIKVRLTGTVTNADELAEVGRSETGGGMTYLFNTVTQKFVMSIGGGRVWFGSIHGDLDQDTKTLLGQLSEFLLESGGGGDVTEIMEFYRAKTGRA